MTAFDADQLATAMMADLLENRSFQRVWIDDVAELLAKGPQERTSSMLPSAGAPDSGSAKHGAYKVIIGHTLLDLVSSAQLAVEVFLRSLNFAVTDRAVSTNRESAELYSVRVQMEWLGMASSFRLPQFLLVARRIKHLLKSFTILISTPYAISSCAFFASSLCDLLYRLEEYSSIHEACAEANALRKATDDFRINVVKQLENRIFSPDVLARQRSTLTLQSAPARIGSPSTSTHVVFRRLGSEKPASRKSFLLPAELECQRQRTRRPSDAQAGARRSEPRRPQSRREQPTKRSSSATPVRRPATSKEARRVAYSITRDVLNDVAGELRTLWLR